MCSIELHEMAGPASTVRPVTSTWHWSFLACPHRCAKRCGQARNSQSPMASPVSRPLRSDSCASIPIPMATPTPWAARFGRDRFAAYGASVTEGGGRSDGWPTTLGRGCRRRPRIRRGHGVRRDPSVHLGRGDEVSNGNQDVTRHPSGAPRSFPAQTLHGLAGDLEFLVGWSNQHLV